MCTDNHNYWQPDYDDYGEEDKSDNDECITLNYDDFLKYQHKSSLWSPMDEYQDEDHDFDESDSQRHNDWCEQYDMPFSQSESATQGEHSCLKLKNEYCYLDPRVYDTRVMRNLTTMDNNLPRISYSPKFIQAALEKVRSLTSWSHDGQVDNFVYDDTQQLQNLERDYYDCSLPKQQQRQISKAAQNSGLRTMVEHLIYDTPVVIFSKTYCPYCVTVKNIFDYMDQPYTVLELDRRSDGDLIQGVIEQITGGTSVPRVFVNGMFIGGSEDVKRLYESGELQGMLDFG